MYSYVRKRCGLAKLTVLVTSKTPSTETYPPLFRDPPSLLIEENLVI